MLYDANGKKVAEQEPKPSCSKEIAAFMRGAVFAWSNNKNSKGESFGVFSLFSKNWKGTPLQELIEKRLAKKTEKEATDAAHQDAGRLLKKILIEEGRFKFSDETKGNGNGTYRLI